MEESKATIPKGSKALQFFPTVPAKPPKADISI
jgi:hypothetical protein